MADDTENEPTSTDADGAPRAYGQRRRGGRPPRRGGGEAHDHQPLPGPSPSR